MTFNAFRFIHETITVYAACCWFHRCHHK